MSSSIFKKILLLVGSSDIGEKAAETAIQLAVANHADLIVLNVVDKMTVNRMQRFSEQSGTEIEIEMEEDGWKHLYAVEEDSKDHGVRTMVMQKTGNVGTEVLQDATRLKVGLIIVASPPKASGQSRRLVQGTLERVIENADVPVLVVK